MGACSVTAPDSDQRQKAKTFPLRRWIVLGLLKVVLVAALLVFVLRWQGLV